MVVKPLNRMSSRIKSSFGLSGHKIDMEATDIALRSKKFMDVPQVHHLDESKENSYIAYHRETAMKSQVPHPLILVL